MKLARLLRNTIENTHSVVLNFYKNYSAWNSLLKQNYKLLQICYYL